jgi:hypothetical protein
MIEAINNRGNKQYLYRKTYLFQIHIFLNKLSNKIYHFLVVIDNEKWVGYWVVALYKLLGKPIIKNSATIDRTIKCVALGGRAPKVPSGPKVRQRHICRVKWFSNKSLLLLLGNIINREMQQIYFMTSWKYNQQRNSTNIFYDFLENIINREIQQIYFMTSWKYNQ